MTFSEDSVNINCEALAIYFCSWQPFWVWRAVVISLASLSLYSRALCPLLSAISSCHVMSYLLGLWGHCLSDWQGFDSTQYPNNPRGLEAVEDHSVARSTGRRSERRGRRAGEKGKDRNRPEPSWIIMTSIQKRCQWFVLSFTLIGNEFTWWIKHLQGLQSQCHDEQLRDYFIMNKTDRLAGWMFTCTLLIKTMHEETPPKCRAMNHRADRDPVYLWPGHPVPKPTKQPPCY